MSRPVRYPITNSGVYRVQSARPDRSGSAPVALVNARVLAAPAGKIVEASAAPPERLRRDVSRGLRYTHFRANANTSELIQIASAVSAATELLSEQGLLDARQLEERKARHQDRIRGEFSDRGMGVNWDPGDADKYTFAGGVRIDCENRIALCQAACCKLRFALSRQDVDEGLVEWDFANPYQIAHGPDAYCVHLDRDALDCSIHAARPTTCRKYDCRTDQRIWLDFENRIANPRIYGPGWPNTGMGSAPGAPAEPAEPQPPEATSLLDRFGSRPLLWRGRGHRLSSYGAFLGAAFFAAALYWQALAGFRFGQAPPVAFVFGLVVAAFAGSRLLYAAERELASWIRQETAPSRGQTFYGGIAGAVAWAAWWFASAPPPLLLLADCAAPALALGYAVAKLGCLSYGCCAGAPTRFRLAMHYFSPDNKVVTVQGLRGVPLIPVQLYESLFGLGLCGALCALPDAWFGSGRAAGLFLALLAAGRAVLMLFRYRALNDYAGLVIASVAHVGFLVCGVLLAARAVPGASVVHGVVGPSLPGMAGVAALAGLAALVLFGVTESGGGV